MTMSVQGFSVLNRGLLYASALLSPSHFIAGYSSTGLTSLGFLAYNWYNQWIFWDAVKHHKLGALSLLPVHFNTIYAITYIAGASAGNLASGLVLALSTSALMIFNTYVAWLSWATELRDGYGEYRFFFFGWRTLTDGWHKFLLCWQIGDSLLALNCVILAITIPWRMFVFREEENTPRPNSIIGGLKGSFSNWKYPGIILGSAAAILFVWPLILWVELIIQQNHIESETDWVSVWLFVAQCGLLVVPSFGGYFLRAPIHALLGSRKTKDTTTATFPLR